MMWNAALLFLICYCVSIYPAEGDKKADIFLDAVSLIQAEGAFDYDYVDTSPNRIMTTESYVEWSKTLPKSLPTWRPTRMNCTAPSIEQFPQPLINRQLRGHGLIIVHILVAIYCFLGLTIVCNEYFVASLSRISKELKLSPDVAGATFMAAGSSAPKLAIVVLGVFLAKDDIGTGEIICSAVFKNVFVISLCALCSGTVINLSWRPLVRDCFFYCVSILVMLIVILNDAISWFEAVVMLLCYVGYCIALICSRKKVQSQPPVDDWGMSQCNQGQGQENMGYHGDQPESVVTGEAVVAKATATASTTGKTQGATAPGGVDEKESRPDPLARPTEGGLPALVAWYVVYPIHFLCKKTMPDCRLAQYRNWYPFTFLLSMVWISFYSYFMVWMITVIGSTLGIPDTVMGLTFVAAGVSVPDALSSIAVIKEGFGDMAVSNAIGSNVFDILVCLGLPWFIQTAIIAPGSHVNVISKGLVYSTLSLFSTVVFLILSTHLNGWKLDKRLGIILMLWYLFFITLASLYELNVFGYMNPPECTTPY
ncbi:hypothetical protein ACLKA6_016096 [Drosophila palustris]